MVFLPVGANRVPTQLNASLALDSLLRRQQAVTKSSVMAATGRRIQVPSDDPTVAAQAELFQFLRERKTQYRENVQSGASALSDAAAALTSVNNTIDAARSIALSTANRPTSEAELDAAVVELDSMIDELLSVANDRIQRRFTFSGHRLGTPAFERDGTEIVFNGDNGTIDAFRELNTLFTINVSANDSFGTETKAGRSGDLNPQLTAATRLFDLNRGRGIQRGQVLINDGGGNSAIVDLSTADSVQDVIDLINNNATLSATVTAALNPAGNGLQVTSTGGNIAITDLAGGTTAFDLGIRADGTAAAVVGGDLNPKITTTTLVSSLLGGTIGALGDIQISNGPHSATIDVSGAVTVGDLLNTINAADLRVRAEINANGDGINVVSVLSGADYSITETSLAGTTATRLGILTTNLSTELADFNRGGGIDVSGADDLRITARNGAVFDIDLSGATTIADVQQIIQTDTAGAILVDINPLGGIRLTDTTGGAGNFIVEDLSPSHAASNLGIAADVASATILGTNNHQTHVDGIFDTLLRLRNAMAARDEGEMAKAARQLDVDRDRALETQAEVGSQLQVLDVTINRLDDELTDIDRRIAEAIEPDFVELITNLLTQQTALEATLSTTGRLLQTSLLDFL